jgi:hypothetical protein
VASTISRRDNRKHEKLAGRTQGRLICEPARSPQVKRPATRGLRRQQLAALGCRARCSSSRAECRLSESLLRADAKKLGAGREGSVVI